ncbi:MAG: hypothetical protein V7693_17780 [Halopseudomonas sabulinigri]
MKHILMVCYGGGHMKVLAPLYAQLSFRYRVTVLALTSAGAYMREQGIPSLGFRDFAFTRSTEIQAYGRKLAADIPDNSVISHEETVAYLGASFFDLVNQLGAESVAQERYRQKGRAAFLPVTSLQKVIAELRVDAVITTNSPRAERAALIAAKNAGLPSICVNDNLWIRGGLADVVKDDLANRICVLTNSVRERLINEAGVDAEKVVVTGTPVFDRLKKIKRSTSFDSKPRVLLADQMLPDIHPVLNIKGCYPGADQAVRSELNLLASKGVIEVFFRPHPNQKYNYTDYSFCSVSPQSEDLYERLSATDVVVTAISTVGIEGRAVGVGLVSIEGTVYSIQNSYEEIGVSTGIRDVSELKDAIFKEYYKACTGKQEQLYEGIATNNIIIVIKDLLG